MGEEKRIKYFDYLRILATFAVVVLHVSAEWFLNADIGSFSWKISNLYDSATRFAVPIFVMISGAIFLNRDMNIKKLYTKYILRMIVAFVFWSIIYAVIAAPTANIKGMVVNVLYGHYHMWFIYMIIGLYMIVPILRMIVKDSQLTRYFLLLAFILCFLLPQSIEWLGILSEPMNLIGEITNTVITKLEIKLFGGFTAYFVAGYYLSNADISKKHRRVIYVLGIIGYAMTVILTDLLCTWKGVAHQLFYGSHAVNVALFTIAVFVYAKYEGERITVAKKIENMVGEFSKCTFGAYLVHALILHVTWNILPYSKDDINTLVGIPLISICVFVVSMIISAILNQVPVLKKYIV